MGAAGAQPGVPGVPFPQVNDDAVPSPDQSVPRSASTEARIPANTDDSSAMDVDMGEATPTKRPAAAATAMLPSIKNLFGIERADNLRDVRRSPSQGDGFAPGSPSSSTRASLASNARSERGPYGHSNSSSFSGFAGGSGSSLGPMRNRQSSMTGSLGRAGISSTPPRQSTLPQMLAGDDSVRRRVELRPRASLKGLLMSPPTRRSVIDGDGPFDYGHTPRRHRPGSSMGSATATQLLPGPEPLVRASTGHVSTLSDPSPSLPLGIAPSSQTSAESPNQDVWGAASTHSESTSPRTSWHSRSSTLESGESSYKLVMSDVMRNGPPPLLPPFRDPSQTAIDLPRRSPEHVANSLARHGGLRDPLSSAEALATRRPRARTLTFSDRPIAPLPGSNDPARRQHLEAASELIRMGRNPPTGPPSGRIYHKHSASMQERAPIPLDVYTSEQLDTRGHRPKSSSMSARGPPLPTGAPYPPGIPMERPDLSRGAFDSFHPRRGRGADEASRPGANFVFPRRPMPDPVEAQRSAYQAHMMRGPGLPSVPDGIVSGRTGPGGSPRSSASGTIASGQAKYECAWCGKRFSRPSSLKIHHHSHTGEKPFVCNEPGCGRSFSVQSNLRRHQKCHAPGNESGEHMARGHPEHHSHSAGPSRSDDPDLWPGGPGQPNQMTRQHGHRASASWHHQPHHQHLASFGSMPQLKDYPPLSRSAFEPGSRSMGPWSHVPQQMAGSGPSGLDPPFMQIRDRRTSESSGEEDETLPSDIMLARDSSKQEMASSHRGPPSVFSSDDEDRPPTSRMRSSTSGSTSGIRIGFSSLLNPTAEASIDEKE
ncbi:hypothetical protein ACQY0O_005960 [Thecaphora frezii]